MYAHTTLRAIVVGSRGHIGLPLTAYLRDLGWNVLEIDRLPAWRPDYQTADLHSPVDIALAALDHRPQVIYNLAGVVSRVIAEQAASLAYHANVGGAADIALLARHTGARLIHVSTSEVYGPVDGHMHEDNPPRPNNRYGLTNLLAEQAVRYEASASLTAVILRPFMLYGEGEEPGAHRSAMSRFAYALNAGQPIAVHHGSQRSWLHMSDACRALHAAATTRLPNATTINIGHPDVRTTLDLAHLLAHHLDADPQLITELPLPPRMTLVKNPALSRQKTLLHFTPDVDLDQGVERVCHTVRLLT